MNHSIHTSTDADEGVDWVDVDGLVEGEIEHQRIVDHAEVRVATSGDGQTQIEFLNSAYRQ